MPLYTYLHPETEELIDVVQRMKDVHIYVDSEGTEWKRVFTPANFSVDGNLNSISSSREFVEKTKDKNYSQGDLQDISKEASDKREKQMGKDPVKRKWFKEYAEQRRGRKHPSDPSRYTS
jgi:predicted nucleic acid-binding Zn ribbon protein